MSASDDALLRLSSAVMRRGGVAVRPALDDRPAVGIVHLGIGAFHRAHQAAYTADAVAHEPGDWGICGVAMRRPVAVDALAPQDGLYALLVRGPEADELQVIGAVREVLLAPARPEAVAERIADPRVHVVTLTVTERGYPRRPDGSLDTDDPEVAADLAGQGPRTAVGLLARGLALRAAGGGAPLTVLSCDNLPRNGRVLRQLVAEYAPDLRDYLQRAVRFPCTMVDRVVPASTPADHETASRMLGAEDRATVVGEPFRQWVIEDDFAGPRPAWDRAGAEVVADTAPYEALKLRVLNGTHSLLAYVGLALGARTVADAWADPDVRAAADGLAADVAPTLPTGLNVDGYRAQLDERWRNVRMAHALSQIALDGDKKLPARLGEVLRTRLGEGVVPRHAALVLAAWGMHRGIPDAREVLDPGVFGGDLAASEPLRAAVAEWLERFEADGVRRALRADA